MTVDTADLILQNLEHVREDLRTLRDEVKAGFEKVNGRLGKLEDRVADLEKWKAEQDAVADARERDVHRTHLSESVRWTSKQVAIASAALFFGAVGTSLAFVSALHLT